MRCVLHIGPTKTGSTSIQQLLRHKKNQLSAKGFFIPVTPHANMVEFRYASSQSLKPTRASKRAGFTREDLASKQNPFRAALSQQFPEARDAGFHTMLVTAESLGGCDAAEMETLKEWLSEFFNDILVVYVLRRQDLRSVSMYKNLVKNNFLTEQNCLIDHPSMHFNIALQAWAKCFGPESISPILFPDSIEDSRDFIQDFCDLIGLEGVYDPAEARKFRRNSALDGRAIELLRILNKELEGTDKSKVSKERKFLERKLVGEFRTKPQKVTPSRSEVETFYARYREGNEEIRKMFFPGRNTLFDEDFSTYPEEASYPDPDLDFIVRLCRAISIGNQS